MTYEHRPEKLHKNANGVSRILCIACVKDTEMTSLNVRVVEYVDEISLDLKILDSTSKRQG